MPQKVGRDIDVVRVENGAVTFTVPETGQTLTLPQALDPSRVDQIIDGHIRAYERGYTDKSGPKKTNEQAAWERSGIPQIIGAIKEAENRVGQGGKRIRELIPALDKLPSIPYRYAKPEGVLEEAGIPLERAAEVVVPAVASGIPQAAGRGAVAVGKGTLAAWAKLPPKIQEYLIKGAVTGVSGTGSYAVLKKLGIIP